MRNPNQSQQNNFDCSIYFDRLKCGSIAIIIIIILVCLMGFAYNELEDQVQTKNYFLNNPQYILPPKYHVWLLVTSLFAQNSFFAIVLIVMNYFSFLYKLETKTSSLWLLKSYFLTGIIIQVVFSCLWWLLNISGDTQVFAYGGASSVWINLIFKYCYFNRLPKIKLCCFQFKIDKIIYPLIMAFIISLIQFRIKLDLIVSLLLGFLQCYFFRGTIFSPRCCCIRQIDKVCVRCCQNNRWISFNDDQYERMKSPFQRISQNELVSTDTSYGNNENIFHRSKGYSMQEDE